MHLNHPKITTTPPKFVSSMKPVPGVKGLGTTAEYVYSPKGHRWGSTLGFLAGASGQSPPGQVHLCGSRQLRLQC